MMKKIVFILNPISGTISKAGVPDLVERHLDHERFAYEIWRTEHAGHATDLARRASREGVDCVVAVGGDGTVNEVGRALVGTETAMGILPCGSGNGLARHLRIPLDIRRAIEVINAGEVHMLDYGTINDHAFFCTCGVGFDAFISEKFAASTRRGLLTYMENTLRSGLQYRPETYIIEDRDGEESCRAFLIACANASQYGNDAYIAPYASMKDGLFDVVVMEPFNAIEAPQVALQLFNGTLPRNSHVKTFKTSHLRIRRAHEGVAHYDGDPFLTEAEIDVRLHSRAFRVVVNPWRDADPTVPRLTRSLMQRMPDFFNEWKKMPETLINKTGKDLKRLNRQVRHGIRALGDIINDKEDE